MAALLRRAIRRWPAENLVEVDPQESLRVESQPAGDFSAFSHAGDAVDRVVADAGEILDGRRGLRGATPEPHAGVVAEPILERRVTGDREPPRRLARRDSVRVGQGQ